MRDEINRKLYQPDLYVSLRQSLNSADSDAINLSAQLSPVYQSFSVDCTALENQILEKGEAFRVRVHANEELEELYGRELTKLIENSDHVLSDEEEALLLPAYEAQDNIFTTRSALDTINLPFQTLTMPNGEDFPPGNSADAAELFMSLGVDINDSSYIDALIIRYNELLDEIEKLL